jgi:hypothetical protein
MSNSTCFSYRSLAICQLAKLWRELLVDDFMCDPHPNSGHRVLGFSKKPAAGNIAPRRCIPRRAAPENSDNFYAETMWKKK